MTHSIDDGGADEFATVSTGALATATPAVLPVVRFLFELVMR